MRTSRVTAGEGAVCAKLEERNPQLTNTPARATYRTIEVGILVMVSVLFSGVGRRVKSDESSCGEDGKSPPSKGAVRFPWKKTRW